MFSYNDLLSGTTNGHVFLQRRARFLGYEPDAPHVVVAMEIERSMASPEASGQQHLTEEQQHTVYQCVQVRVQDTYPGSLIDMCGSELLGYVPRYT